MQIVEINENIFCNEKLKFENEVLKEFNLYLNMEIVFNDEKVL